MKDLSILITPDVLGGFSWTGYDECGFIEYGPSATEEIARREAVSWCKQHNYEPAFEE